MTMKYVEAPGYMPTVPGHKRLFLAGGITGCPDWQMEITSMLRYDDLTIVNPRRANFPINNPNAAYDQIRWEHQHLRWVDGILFWFPMETLCPIVLYELGAHSMTSKPLFVGTHPDYARKGDVIIQTQLARPDVFVVHNLEALYVQVKDWLAS